MKTDKFLILLTAMAFFNPGFSAAALAGDTSEISIKETAKNKSTVEAAISEKNDREEKKPMADSIKSIKWHEYLTEALKLARENNKPVMVDTYTSWCGWCKKMDKETFADQSIIELSSSFVCLRVNPEEDETFSSKYTIKDFPTVIFLKSDGTEIDRQVGFKTSEDFKKILKAILEKTNKH